MCSQEFQNITQINWINCFHKTGSVHINCLIQVLSRRLTTLSPWFVPSLLVDDDDKWISEISNKGPQVITGMRGCGKTMLIRALQFHARAIPRDPSESKDTNVIISRLKNENYIGIYVSCTRLLDGLGNQDQPLYEPFTRLFVAYALEAINAVRHLRELDRKSMSLDSFQNIANAMAMHITGAEDLKNLSSEQEIEGEIKNILNSLSKGEGDYTIRANPAIAFPQLAKAICKCSTLWQNHYVFFLLDDVSTRFLNDQNIIRLVSSLLFQNEFCSFKFTTEAQTLELVINSPGNIEQARIGRDYNVFDLGHEVNVKVHSNKKEGIAFVEKILFKRAKFHLSHPQNVTPSQILGDTSLQSIAENISKSGKSIDKKGLYYGITAIAGVCVGDIGDIITLYEMIFKERVGNNPVSAIVQNECYLKLCNSRLFDIDRRESRLFDFAQSFAEAAHFLLVQSSKQKDKNGKIRLRQYSSIFINVSSGNIEKQNIQVRALIDAGIFNFSGGPQGSRTNRQGFNPQQQFKLIYRKLYGVNKHIGLAQSDRFELSGEALEEWLNYPKKGKEILIRNLNKSITDNDELDGLSDVSSDYGLINLSIQKTIVFAEESIQNEIVDLEDIQIFEELANKRTPISSLITLNEIKETIIMAGLGFERSTLESFRKILVINPLDVILVKFKEIGKSKEMLELIKNTPIRSRIIDFSEAIIDTSIYKNETLFDITGFPQSVIFNSIKNSLVNKKEVRFALT